MDDWQKFSETTLPEKEEFCSNLNMEDITDADYMHAKRVCKSKIQKMMDINVDLLQWSLYFLIKKLLVMVLKKN